MKPTSEAAFETAIEAALLADGCLSLPSTAFDRERAIFFPATVQDFILETQPKEWSKLETLHGDETGSGCWPPCASGWIPMGCCPPCAMVSNASARHCVWPFSGLLTA